MDFISEMLLKVFQLFLCNLDPELRATSIIKIDNICRLDNILS